GALSVPEGRVQVAWTIAGDRPSRLELTWSERNGPKIEGLPTGGFGTEIIARGIRFELGGGRSLGRVDGGFQCRIVIPANPQYLSFGPPPDSPRKEEAAS